MTKRELIKAQAERLKLDANKQRVYLQPLKREDLEHEIIIDGDGTLRFKPIPLFCWLKNNSTISMDRLISSGLADSEIRKFYRGIGYTICGFLEIFGEN